MGNFSTKNAQITFITFTLPSNIFAVYVTYNISEQHCDNYAIM